MSCKEVHIYEMGMIYKEDLIYIDKVLKPLLEKHAQDKDTEKILTIRRIIRVLLERFADEESESVQKELFSVTTCL